MLSLRPFVCPPSMKQTFSTLKTIGGELSSQTLTECRYHRWGSTHAWLYLWPFTIKFTFDASPLNTLVNNDDWLARWHRCLKSRHQKKHVESTSHTRQSPQAWWTEIQCPSCKLSSPYNGIVPPLLMHAIYTPCHTNEPNFLPLT
jgi:hypothetical protein